MMINTLTDISTPKSNKQMLQYTQDNLQKVISAVKKHLTPDLINKEYRQRNRELPEFGQCLNASGAVHYFFRDNFHLYSAEDTKNFQRFGRGKFYHWWLVNKETEDIVDLTAEQYKDDRQNLKHLYDIGERRSGTPGFNYRKRLNLLIDRVRKELNMAETTSVELVNSKEVRTQVSQAVADIQAAYQTAQKSYLDFCRLIFDYKQRNYWNSIRQELIDKNIFGDSTLKKLEAIGGSAPLLRFKDVGMLPEGYNTLYELSKIKKQENWDKAIKHISSATTLAEAKDLASRYGTQSSVKPATKAKPKPSKSSTNIKRTIYVELANERGNLGKLKDLEQNFKMNLKKLDPKLVWQVE